MKRKIGLVLLAFILTLSCVACGKKNKNSNLLVTYPIELFAEKDAKDITKSYVDDLYKYKLSQWVPNGTCTNLDIIDSKEVKVEYTREQADNEIKSLKAAMLEKFTPNAPDVQFSDDYTELTITANSPELTNEVTKACTASLLFLQIIDGKNYNDARVAVTIKINGSDKDETAEYTCFDYFK